MGSNKRSKMLAGIGVGLACLSMVVLGAPAATATPMPGPDGPCVQQPSGVRTYSTTDGWTTSWHFQNCNSYGISIKSQYYSTFFYWGGCTYLAPGETLHAYPDGLSRPQAQWMYC